MPKKPEVICLCGSTRFYERFQELNYLFTMAGYIVLSVGFHPHSAKHSQDTGCSEDERKKLNELHLRKIDLANSVFVINKGGYIGDDTRREIEYAVNKRKFITYDEKKNEIAREAERKGRLIFESSVDKSMGKKFYVPPILGKLIILILMLIIWFSWGCAIPYLKVIEDDKRPWRGCASSECENTQWICTPGGDCEIRRVR